MGVPQNWVYVYVHAAPLDGNTPHPSVGLCGDTHLDRCSQELKQLMKFHSSDYITGAVDLDLQEPKECWVGVPEMLNMGETMRAR